MAALSVSMNHVTATIIFFVFVAQVTVMVNVCFANGDQSNILCHETEKQALLSFKQDLVDDYNKLVSWDVSKEEDCCKWDGISCNTLTGHVSELSLKGGSFTGKINPSLLNLTHLLSLDLSLNNFSQIIPSFMGSLVSLRYLNFTYGGFKGKIPHQLGNLSSLHYLVLEDYIHFHDLGWSLNSLYVENLHWVSGLSSLKSLVMNEVNLSKASDHWLFAINTLPSLQEVRLSYCDLGHIHFPSHINLTSLETLDLSENSLELGGPIPCTIRNNMSLLKYLDLSDNNMNSVNPKCFYSFPYLASLDLSYNNLQGTISSDIANLTSIVRFDLSLNALAGNIPKSIGKLFKLEKLDISYNQLSGPLPESVGSLKKLQSLDISNNNLSGPLPKSLGSLSKLKSLRIYNNQLSGPLPESLGSLKKLQSLYISNNNLSGPLPKSFGSLSNLEFLNIESNNLEGAVSEVHFSNLTNLMQVYASGNKLTMNVSSHWIPPFSLGHMELRNWNLGPHFPTWLKSQKEVSFIDMSNTGISDVIPCWLWNFSSYKSINYVIDLSENQIYGEIPEFPNDASFVLFLNSNKLTGPLPRIPVCFSLDLSNNYLSGNISNFLCHPKSNSRDVNGGLNLKNNLLSGKIPDCWMYWPSLSMINLDNNNLTGKIPRSIGSLHQMRSLHIRNNSLIGEIPEALQNCSTLTGLDVSFNKLVGTIPRWIESLPMLSVLVLRSNNLTGLIPIELCKLSTLQVFDASNNNLIGIIPKCFKNLTGMTSKSIESFLGNYFGIGNRHYKENAQVVIKGRENQYDTILYLLSTLDLSDNKLSGEISEELTSLDALQSLNLSGNYLSGNIPNKIGNMTDLESLDLSRNRLSGHIPSSMSSLTFLSFLNLSYNNLAGQIPTSTQLQSMNASSFIGNKLCGPPLLIKCRDDHETVHQDASTEDGERQDDEYWFRLGIGMGFGVSFVGVIGPLLVCGYWRHAYFWFFEEYLWYKFVDYFIKVKYMF